MPYAGTFGRVFGESLDAARTMRSFSFKVMGDGNRYYMRLPTFETIEGDHWVYVFQTVKDEISTVTINIPEDLIWLDESDTPPRISRKISTVYRFSRQTPELTAFNGGI